MSTSPIVRKDEGTQTTPPPGTAPSPETTSATNHDVATQSPAPSLLHPERQTDEVSETSADETAAPAGTRDESSPKEILLLGTVPDDFGPAYDYLGTVKKLADEIELGLYETYFEERFTEDSARISLFRLLFDDSCRHSEMFRFLELGKPEIYSDIVELREGFYSVSQGGQPVLLMEATSKVGVQAIGMAFNVNPCFFAMHLLPKHDLWWLTDELEQLGNNFESYVLSQSEVEGQPADGMRQWAMEGTDWRNCSSDDGRIRSGRTWSSGDSRRITIGNARVGFGPRIFEAQRSWNGCKI